MVCFFLLTVRSVLVVDCKGDFAVLSMYNIGERGIKQSDDIFVAQPQLEEHTFTYESKVVDRFLNLQ